MTDRKDYLLEIENLSISFSMYDKSLSKISLQVIKDLYLNVYPGEIVAVAGASGSGKSLLAAAVMGILPENAKVSGKINYKCAELTEKRLKALRGREIAFVPQSVSFLDPLMKTGKQVTGTAGRKSRDRMTEIFKRLGLPPGTEKLYPYELSGGMARRVLVASALISDAQLIIADEPTPGMSKDRAEDTFRMFREEADKGKSVIIITHDIDTAFEFADRVAVFYAGSTLEIAPAEDFIKGPGYLRHPYSKALWQALPQNGFIPADGLSPYAGKLPEGCLYAPRCPYKTEECIKNVPPVTKIRGGEVRCFHGT